MPKPNLKLAPVEPEERLASFIEKSQEVLSVPFTTPRKNAEKWFAKAVKHHEAFTLSMKTARRELADAAFGFLRCRSAYGYGEWEEFLRLHSTMPSRTVRFYLQIARHAQDWVLRSPEINPKPKTIDDVNALARDLIIYSPKPLIALCRELELMRPFGEYDAVKHSQDKLHGQIEFSFDRLTGTLDLLNHLGEENFILTLPEGMQPGQAFDELADKCDQAAKQLHAASDSIKAATKLHAEADATKTL